MEGVQFLHHLSDEDMRVQHWSQLAVELQHLRVTQTMTDVTLLCKRDKKLRAHRVVLSAASNYFRRLNYDTNAFLLLLNFDVETVKIAVDFMYTGKVRCEYKSNTDELKKIAVIGIHLELPVLVQWCSQHLANVVDRTNCKELFAFAHATGVPYVAARATTLLAANFIELNETDEIQELEVTLLKSILQSPDLEYFFMSDVCDAILKWIGFDPARKGRLSELMMLLDLNQFTDEYLFVIIGHELIREDNRVFTLLFAECTIRNARRLRSHLEWCIEELA